MGKRIDDDPLAVPVPGQVSLDNFYKEDAHKCEDEDTEESLRQDYMSAERFTEMLDHDAEDNRRENRIEALRAASRIVSGKYEAFKVAGYGPGSLTIQLAEQFAKYLEGNSD